MTRRKGDVDEITKQPITLPALGERVLKIERRVWRDRLESRFLYLVILGMIVFGASLYGSTHEAADNAATAAREGAKAADSAQRAIVKIDAEADQRRDQSCTIFERNQRADIKSLQRTYDYISSLSADQLREPINTAILTFLPETEKDARTDDAPKFCDEMTPDGHNIGLPEPDLPMPKRPKNIPHR